MAACGRGISDANVHPPSVPSWQQRSLVSRPTSVRIVRRHPARLRVDDEVELRVLTPADAKPLFALTDRNRDHLRPWLIWVDDVRSAKDTAAFIRGARDQRRANNGFQAGIWFRGVLVGVVGYHYWNWVGGKTEIGYWLAADAQGKGIMTRACGALVDYAFRVLGLNRVEIRAAVSNARSRKVTERLGFVQEGVLREGEVTVNGRLDQVVYGLLRMDWERRHPEGALKPSPSSRSARSS